MPAFHSTHRNGRLITKENRKFPLKFLYNRRKWVRRRRSFFLWLKTIVQRFVGTEEAVCLGKPPTIQGQRQCNCPIQWSRRQKFMAELHFSLKNLLILCSVWCHNSFVLGDPDDTDATIHNINEFLSDFNLSISIFYKNFENFI